MVKEETVISERQSQEQTSSTDSIDTIQTVFAFNHENERISISERFF